MIFTTSSSGISLIFSLSKLIQAYFLLNIIQFTHLEIFIVNTSLIINEYSLVDIEGAFIRGFEKPLTLWLLCDGPKTGYEIMIELTRLTGKTLNPSSIYPFLHWLDEQELAFSEWVTKGGRKMRYYSLTNRGKELYNNIQAFFQGSLKTIFEHFLQI